MNIMNSLTFKQEQLMVISKLTDGTQMDFTDQRNKA